MKTRTRCHFIGIYSPPSDAEKRVTWCRESVLEVDGVKVGKPDQQPGDLTARFVDIAATSHTVTDPITGQPVTFSAAALARWLQADFDARQTADDARIAAEAAAAAAAAANQEPAP